MNVFDIIGPVMIGPSSSHTAGGIAGTVEELERAEILLHGSFAKTYKGHGTDKALIAGIMGMKPDDARLRSSFELAEQAGLSFEITTGHLEDAHPNTAQITLYGEDSQVSVQGASVGGGNILINRINGMAVEISGQFTTLIVLHRDAPGTIAHVTELLGSNGINIANFRLAREQKGGTAVMTIEIDGDAGKELNRQVAALENVLGSTMLKPI